jgi:lipopolysaccharide transport system ATP-binding protein
MSQPVILVEHLYKQYRLGMITTGTLSHDLNRWWHRIRGIEDPYEKITSANDCTEKGNDDYVWALQNINFLVTQGEVLGIIGKNGAGKSTLLKILSKVTAPTKGNIKIKGRIASLLEVGTGFHPELSGRENIFLNGAILGMTKEEIKSKFDEIVDFSGVEKYIDTPVKRYSSGMYVRLAFAVAAHLEPEILIVDEVLAVGDAEFQKKCLGKMKDVSVQGRTVLFVSHNMAAMKQLCNRGLLIKQGNLIFDGNIHKTIDEYLSSENILEIASEYKKEIDEKKDVQLVGAKIIAGNGEQQSFFDISEDIYIQLNIICKSRIPGLYGYVAVKNIRDELFIESDTFDKMPNVLEHLEVGTNFFNIKINACLLPIGEYIFYVSFASSFANNFLVDVPGNILKFAVSDNTTQRGIDRKSTTSFLLKWEKQYAK